MDREEYIRGDIVAMDEVYGSEADFDTWTGLEYGESKPLAMLLNVADFRPPDSPGMRIMHTTVGISPNIDEFIELEAFSRLKITEDDQRAVRENDLSSSWVELRRLAEQNGWTLAETALQAGGVGFSVRCRLDRAAISPMLSIQEIRTRGFDVIYERVAGFMLQVADLDARVYEHLMEPRKSQGCYVATAVYGSYECPEVRTLRRWRDTVLVKRPGGAQLIALYYAFSPALVRAIGHTRPFAAVVKPFLDAFVRRINKVELLANAQHN